MADVMWEIPGNPAYDNFITEWISLNPEQYPSSGSTQLTWHETFAYTCLQVMVEGYAVLVQNANKITNETERLMRLREIRHGRRSQNLTIPFLGARTYNSPTGNFTLDKDGNPAKVQVGIFSFQNHSSVPNGKVDNETVSIFNPVQFKGGSTHIPRDSPSADELYPQSSSPFGVTMIVLTSILFLAIISTAVIVIVNRDNIIIKSASPLFCVLELIGLSLTLSWIYLRADVPPPGICRIGLMVVMIGLTINLSALVVKNYRIYRIFNSVSIINHAVSNKYLLRVVAVPVVITLIPCIVHCFVHYLEPDLIRTNNDQFWVQCSSDDPQYVWDVVIGATPVILTFFGVYLAFKTRNVTRLWNEARAIATTIYVVTFFIIIIVIVQTFPQSLYQVSYHVTVVCIFAASFLEYCILFVPKLRNLWLQKRGLHVRAGRDGDMMDSVHGGINANAGRRGRVSNASHADEAVQDYMAGEREKRHGSTAGVVSERRSSDISDAQPNMNISDLVSSYPFGQINNDVGSSSLTSPVHRPTIYGHSNLSNRCRKTMGAQESNIDSLDLSDPTHPLSKRPSLSAGGSTSIVDGNQGENSQAKNGGYGIFGGNRLNTARSNRDAQSLDLHEILLASSNNRTAGERTDGRRTSGMLTVNSGSGGAMDFLADPDRDMFSRKSSFGDFDHLGPGRTRSATLTGVPVAGSMSRSPKLYPLHPNTGHSSMKSGIRETRMDSYTVVVPVQRQRWYIMKVLAQWRMSKIIFVPYSKVLVIVDLETEKSSSLILHSIEPGYFSTEDLISEIPSRGQSIRPADLEPTRSHLPAVLARNSSDQSARTIQFSHQIVPAVHSSSMLTERRLTTATEGAAEPQAIQDSLKTPSNSTAVHLSSLAATASGTEPLEARPSLRRRASQQVINNVKNMAFSFGLDMRQMDGATRTFEDSLAGIEEGIQTDYIIRVISIHNECWRIQLPDQETMDRWVEIGQQIKDDNWIARPINGGRGSISTRRDPSDGPSSGGTEEDGGSAFDRSHMLQGRNHNRTFHPLQHHDGDNEPGSGPGIQTDERWLSDLTDSSVTSNETERQIIRERAARMNQQLRANSKFPAISLRVLRPESVRSGSSAPTLELSQGTSVSDSTVSKRPKKPPAQSSLSRIVTLPTPSNDLDGADAEATVALSEPSTAVPGGSHQLNGNDLDSLLITRRRTEEADLREILAETNIAYQQGQHAVYEDDDPTVAHRTHRIFNNLQYDYNRRRLQDEEVPRSPEWHLTSLELAQMESKRTLAGGDHDLPSNDSTRLPVDGLAQQQPVMGQALTDPVPMVSVTAPPETLTSPWSIPSSPSQESREAVPPMAPPMERFVSMSPMVMHLPPTFPKFSPPGEGGVAISEEERTNGLFEDSRIPQLLDHLPGEDQAIAEPMPPTLENNSDTGRAGQ
ncbi:hypothetical protein EMPS_00654 [Entomortierella parvispora]|uniref:G-protein coupled receptors family 3 profile domain-containing protein n=1 Tax=Entomortierella parvispora TaxID=205924 RepID=A0A9P3H235_9FUNG|nr:hypothetical protein EMPS_00654 [Entomortierella parvispora]